jgi:DegV family protein with EDD domain
VIKIATDTIADLPPAVIGQHQIHIIPAWVYLKTGRVRTDALDTKELYDRLSDEPETPRTEPLSEDEYAEIFTGLVGKDDILILVSASHHISQVFENASRAAQKVSPTQIAVHDSGGISLWQGFQAMRAAQMAAAGQDGEAILGTLARMSRQSQFFFVLNDLSYLHRGGRVNLAQYMLGVVFDLKPILAMRDGQIVPVGRVRGRERSMIEMQVRLLESMRNVLSVWVGVVHTGVPDLAQRLASQMQNTLRPAYSLVTEAGPTISIHAGPGALGVVVCPC